MALVQPLQSTGYHFLCFYLALNFAFFMKMFSGFLIRIVPFLMFLIFLFGEGYYTLPPFCLALIAAIFVFKRKTADEEVMASPADDRQKMAGSA